MSGLFDRIRSRALRASGTYNPAQWLIDWIRGGEPTASGKSVNAESAMRIGAVYSCVRVIAEDVAKLPLHLYRRLPEGGKARADDHAAAVRMRTPNDVHDELQFRETLSGHAVLRGNGYAEIVIDNRGRPAELVPLKPDQVAPMTNARADGIGYRVTRNDGAVEDLPRARMLHLRGLSLDGIVGLSPISYHRETFGLALAQTDFAARFFANDAQSGLILKNINPAFKFGDKEQRDNFIKSIIENRTAKNAHMPLPLEFGFEAQKLQMSNTDAQFIESRKLSRSEIAAIFRVPPHKIGDLEKATFSNIEHQALEYVVDTLMPWLRRWERMLDRALLTEAERGVYFFEHLIDGLLRGDVKARWEAYTKALQFGVFNPDEVREKENMNPRADGQGGKYLPPPNTAGNPAGAPGATEDEGRDAPT